MFFSFYIFYFQLLSGEHKTILIVTNIIRERINKELHKK